MRVVNRISVADVMRGGKQQQIEYVEVNGKKQPKKDDAGNFVLRVDDKGAPLMGSIDKNVAQPLYLVMGKARDSKTGSTQYGDYTEFFGAFEARRLGDGEVFQSGRVIFPPPTDAVVENMFSAAKNADPTAEVGFAFVIGTEEHRHGDEVKFRYTCEPIPLGDQAKQDPLADIKAAISKANPLLLPAPPSAPSSAEASEGKSEPEPDTGKARGRQRENA